MLFPPQLGSALKYTEHLNSMQGKIPNLKQRIAGPLNPLKEDSKILNSTVNSIKVLNSLPGL